MQMSLQQVTLSLQIEIEKSIHAELKIFITWTTDPQTKTKK